MLDKSIEWLRVILKRNPGTPLPPVLLPQGYAFVTYQEGDEQAWSEIEVSARTFETVEEAVVYFRQTFVPSLDEVKRRTIFLPGPGCALEARCSLWTRRVVPRRLLIGS